MRLLVGVTGFEPAASSSRTTRATKLRHTPWVAKNRSGGGGSGTGKIPGIVLFRSGRTRAGGWDPVDNPTRVELS